MNKPGRAEISRNDKNSVIYHHFLFPDQVADAANGQDIKNKSLPVGASRAILPNRRAVWEGMVSTTSVASHASFRCKEAVDCSQRFAAWQGGGVLAEPAAGEPGPVAPGQEQELLSRFASQQAPEKLDVDPTVALMVRFLAKKRSALAPLPVAVVKKVQPVTKSVPKKEWQALSAVELTITPKAEKKRFTEQPWWGVSELPGKTTPSQQPIDAVTIADALTTPRKDVERWGSDDPDDAALEAEMLGTFSFQKMDASRPPATPWDDLPEYPAPLMLAKEENFPFTFAETEAGTDSQSPSSGGKGKQGTS